MVRTYLTFTTKFKGPSRTRGSHILARSPTGASLSVAYDHGKDEASNHLAAAEALARKFGYTGEYVGGTLDESTKVWVYMGDEVARFKLPAR